VTLVCVCDIAACDVNDCASCVCVCVGGYDIGLHCALDAHPGQLPPRSVMMGGTFRAFNLKFNMDPSFHCMGINHQPELCGLLSTHATARNQG
jgi:hypothetical protein